MITHFLIYVTTEESVIAQVYSASGTSVAIGIDKIPCSFWFQVAAVNPAGVGEHSPPQNLTFDREFAYCNTDEVIFKDFNNVIIILLYYSTVYDSTYRVYGFHKFNYSQDH
jgi:hypothetical protein